MGAGLSGWLAPNGEFKECGYMEHGDAAFEMLEQMGKTEGVWNDFEAKDKMKDEFFYIPMGVSYISGGWLHASYDPVTLDANITVEQKAWLLQNFDRLNAEQQNFARQYLEDAPQSLELTSEELEAINAALEAMEIGEDK